MCFSPQADLVGGAIVTAIGIDAVRHLGRRPGHLALASLPVLLGLHQLDETFVWWGQQGRVSPGVAHVALWIYLVVAFVILPIYLPLAVLALENTRRRRQAMLPFVAIGTVVAGWLLAALIRGPFSVHERPHHLGYSLKISDGLLIVCLYIVAACGALLFSRYRHIVIYGIFNLIAVAVLARLTIDGFASLWCGYAALSGAAIALHMRLASRRKTNSFRLA